MGWIRGCGGILVWFSCLSDPHSSAIDRESVFDEEFHCFRVYLVFFFQYSICERLWCVVFEYWYRSLEDDRSCVDALVHEVDRATCDLDSVVECLFLGV